MGYLYLRPAEIHYSQRSIKNRFVRTCAHSTVTIGQTLDELCDGKIQLSDFRTIRVTRRENWWISCDNRRLWVLKNLELLGKCQTVKVRKIPVTRIPSHTFTSKNGGTSVKVRGDPGGKWFKQTDPVSECPVKRVVCESPSNDERDDNTNDDTRSDGTSSRGSNPSTTTSGFSPIKAISDEGVSEEMSHSSTRMSIREKRKPYLDADWRI